jgi:pimeloyl-ACP methyl ester carboxylesterase
VHTCSLKITGVTAAPGRARIVPAPSGEPATTAVTHPDPGLLDAAALAATYADELLVGTARHTHLAISKRVFGLLGIASHDARRIHALHDGVATGIYGSMSLGLHAAGTGLARLGRSGVGPRLNDSTPGRALQSAVNGLIGERLSTHHPHLALQLSIRVGGHPVRPRATDLAEAFPDASRRVVVFLHGLGEQEGNWGFRAQEMGGTYGTRLATVGGWTPVYLRANTGLGVGVNGVALTSLLQDLVDHWPVPLERLALVGHSMGGLIMRSACAVATPAPQPWVDRLTDLVTLGTPHLGADLALGTKHGSALLRLLEETSGFHRILEHRSPGIRDLERGLPDLPPLPHVRYRLVSAEVGSPRVPLGRIFGDLLVRRRSAHGVKRTGLRRTLRLFPDADVLHVPRANHFSLLNHPDVDRAMRRWLA